MYLRRGSEYYVSDYVLKKDPKPSSSVGEWFRVPLEGSYPQAEQSLKEEMALEVEWSGARIDHGGNKGHHIIIPGDYEFRIRREIRTLINLVHFLRAIYVDFKPKAFQRR